MLADCLRSFPNDEIQWLCTPKPWKNGAFNGLEPPSCRLFFSVSVECRDCLLLFSHLERLSQSIYPPSPVVPLSQELFFPSPPFFHLPLHSDMFPCSTSTDALATTLFQSSIKPSVTFFDFTAVATFHCSLASEAIDFGVGNGGSYHLSRY